MHVKQQVLHEVPSPAAAAVERRKAKRRQIAIPGQIVWRDAGGTTRTASVVTRDVSELGVRIECLQGHAIPAFRIVYLQLDRVLRERADLPPALKKPNVLSAIFRVGECSPRTGAPTQYALRLLEEPGGRTREEPHRLRVRT